MVEWYSNLVGVGIVGQIKNDLVEKYYQITGCVDNFIFKMETKFEWISVAIKNLYYESIKTWNITNNSNVAHKIQYH